MNSSHSSNARTDVNSTIAQAIQRFRSSKPLSRQERQNLGISSKPSEFWWQNPRESSSKLMNVSSTQTPTADVASNIVPNKSSLHQPEPSKAHINMVTSFDSQEPPSPPRNTDQEDMHFGWGKNWQPLFALQDQSSRASIRSSAARRSLEKSADAVFRSVDSLASYKSEVPHQSFLHASINSPSGYLHESSEHEFSSEIREAGHIAFDCTVKHDAVNLAAYNDAPKPYDAKTIGDELSRTIHQFQTSVGWRRALEDREPSYVQSDIADFDKNTKYYTKKHRPLSNVLKSLEKAVKRVKSKYRQRSKIRSKATRNTENWDYFSSHHPHLQSIHSNVKWGAYEMYGYTSNDASDDTSEMSPGFESTQSLTPARRRRWRRSATLSSKPSHLLPAVDFALRLSDDWHHRDSGDFSTRNKGLRRVRRRRRWPVLLRSLSDSALSDSALDMSSQQPYIRDRRPESSMASLRDALAQTGLLLDVENKSTTSHEVEALHNQATAPELNDVNSAWIVRGQAHSEVKPDVVDTEVPPDTRVPKRNFTEVALMALGKHPQHVIPYLTQMNTGQPYTSVSIPQSNHLSHESPAQIPLANLEGDAWLEKDERLENEPEEKAISNPQFRSLPGPVAAQVYRPVLTVDTQYDTTQQVKVESGNQENHSTFSTHESKIKPTSMKQWSRKLAPPQQSAFTLSLTGTASSLNDNQTQFAVGTGANLPREYRNAPIDSKLSKMQNQLSHAWSSNFKQHQPSHISLYANSSSDLRPIWNESNNVRHDVQIPQPAQQQYAADENQETGEHHPRTYSVYTPQYPNVATRKATEPRNVSVDRMHSSNTSMMQRDMFEVEPMQSTCNNGHIPASFSPILQNNNGKTKTSWLSSETHPLPASEQASLRNAFQFLQQTKAKREKFMQSLQFI